MLQHCLHPSCIPLLKKTGIPKIKPPFPPKHAFFATPLNSRPATAPPRHRATSPLRRTRPGPDLPGPLARAASSAESCHCRWTGPRRNASLGRSGSARVGWTVRSGRVPEEAWRGVETAHFMMMRRRWRWWWFVGLGL